MDSGALLQAAQNGARLRAAVRIQGRRPTKDNRRERRGRIEQWEWRNGMRMSGGRNVPSVKC